MLIHEFLSRSAEKHPDKTAVVCGEQRATYAQLETQACELGRWLVSKNFKSQDRVLIFLDNSIESVVSLFGVLKAGGIFILLNPGMKPGKLGYIFQDSAARFCITQPSKSRVLQDAFQLVSHEIEHLVVCSGCGGQGRAAVETGLYQVWSWEEVLLEGRAGSLSVPRIIDIDLASIIYTSGSTGDPKGVMCAHANMAAACTSICSYLENTCQDIVLSALPLSFDYGLYQVLMMFMVGARVVLERSFLYPFRVLERLEREKATGLPLVPTMAAMLLRMENLDRFDFGSLRYISNTAAALPRSHIHSLQSLFPQVQVFSMYGLTECKRVSYLPPADLTRKPDSVGLPMPNEDVFILDDQGDRVQPGVIGELVVRGANVMQGYWNAPQETARRFRPGRYRGEALLYTGDYFWQDSEGYLYFVGRMDDQLKTRGERVSPKEVENVLCAMDGVAEAAVIGTPDALLGQALKAFVVLHPGWTLQENQMLRYCTQHLEPFMVPKRIECVDDLPKTANGKIDKQALLNV